MVEVKLPPLVDIGLLDFNVVNETQSLKSLMLEMNEPHTLKDISEWISNDEHFKLGLIPVYTSNILVAVPSSQARSILSGFRIDKTFANGVKFIVMNKATKKFCTNGKPKYYVRNRHHISYELECICQAKINTVLEKVTDFTQVDWDAIEDELAERFTRTLTDHMKSDFLKLFPIENLEPAPEPLPTTWWNKLWNRNK